MNASEITALGCRRDKKKNCVGHGTLDRETKFSLIIRLRSIMSISQHELKS